MLTADPLGEGVWFPLTEGGFEAFNLEPRKTGAIVVVSKELLEAADSRSFATLRRELQSAAIAAADDLFLGIATLDMAPTTATADPLADLRIMLGTTNSGSAGTLLAAFGVGAANAASTVAGSSGNRIFPICPPRAGASWACRPL